MDRFELQQSARKAFGEAGLAPDPASSWSKLTEMGWFMMTVPEAQGGLGLGREAAAAIHYELGRALVAGPAIAHMLVIEALSATGHDVLLGRAMGGELMTSSLACPHQHSLIEAVPDADKASYLLVDQGESIFMVPLDQCHVTARQMWDETRRFFDVRLPTLNDEWRIAQGPSAKALSEQLQTLMLLALSAESVGGAEAALAMTVEYLKTRRQFDRPLAMFQALKHRVADLKIAHSAAEALLWDQVNSASRLTDMGALKAYCTAAYKLIAEEAIQLHGGIGLTQEHVCHMFLKRALLNCALAGDGDHWNEMAGRALMDKAP